MPVQVPRLEGEQVDVFRNLTEDSLSVRAVEGDAGGLLVDRADSVFLADPEFVVDREKRREARASGEKTVHAWVRGEYVTDPDPPGETTTVVYDPSEHAQFVERRSGDPVRGGRLAQVHPNYVLLAR